MGLRHNKDPEVILGSLIIAHHGGATHRLTQQAIFKTVSAKNDCINHKKVAERTLYRFSGYFPSIKFLLGFFIKHISEVTLST